MLAAGESAGEEQWPMPIPEEMDERIHSSKIADLAQHDWTRWGGGLFAAAFLREFTAGLPWAHLDIAGPAFNSGGPSGHVTSGGTGFAVATLVDYARTARLTCHFWLPQPADLSLPVAPNTPTCHFRHVTCHWAPQPADPSLLATVGRSETDRSAGFRQELTGQRSPRSFLRRL